MMNATGLSQAYAASDEINAITIGTCLNPGVCAAGVTRIVPSQFHGKIDDFRVYSRALSSSEILSMANP
jgi:hypothetical protein